MKKRRGNVFGCMSACVSFLSWILYAKDGEWRKESRGRRKTKKKMGKDERVHAPLEDDVYRWGIASSAWRASAKCNRSKKCDRNH